MHLRTKNAALISTNFHKITPHSALITPHSTLRTPHSKLTMKFKSTLIATLMLISFTSWTQSQISWSLNLDLAPSSSGSNHPHVVLDGSGNPLVVWNHASRCMFSRWNGTAFTTPVLLNPANLNVAGADWMGPDIASHGDTVYVVFKEIPESSSDSHIYCVHSYDGGANFSTPVRVDYIADSLSRFPTVTTDDQGNPIVGFMKFDNSFGESRWAVCRSNDLGNTFLTDVKASAWSDSKAEICDCCPGTLTCSGGHVAMIYRDNNDNIRDTWAGISTDTGNTFSTGIGIDQQNWFLSACPANGPDGIIVGDTLYGTFMNGASGKNLVYYSKSSITDLSGASAMPLTGTISGLSQQNYPRMDSDGKAMAIAWQQVVSGKRQGILRFTNDISSGLPSELDTITLDYLSNCDVAVGNGHVHVVWQNTNTGSIKYRKGDFSPLSSTKDNNADLHLSVYPNPSSGIFYVDSDMDINRITIFNLFGQVIQTLGPQTKSSSFTLRKSGLYLVQVETSAGTAIRKIVVK